MSKALGKGRSFTLVELLVVIAIIVILMGMTLPAISKVRSLAHSIYCKNNLRELGVAFQSYMTDYKDNMPYIIAMPSLGINEDPAYQRLCDVLSPFVGGSSKVFRCPADRGASTEGVITDTTDEDGNTATSSASSASSVKSEFENEGSSYEFNEFLCGRKITNRPKVMVMHDYRPYHGTPGAAGAANYLFADGHVGDF